MIVGEIKPNDAGEVGVSVSFINEDDLAITIQLEQFENGILPRVCIESYWFTNLDLHDTTENATIAAYTILHTIKMLAKS